jgi:hypothetical protein
MKLFQAASGDLKTPVVILAGVGAPMLQANDQHAAAEDSTGFLACIAHAAAEAVADATHRIIQFTKQIFAHGEGHGFGSVVTLAHQISGLLCDVFLRLHQWLASFCSCTLRELSFIVRFAATPQTAPPPSTFACCVFLVVPTSPPAMTTLF